jgi:hypothetical protein
MCSIALPPPNKQYKTDHSSVFSCQYQVIGCPQYRRKVLVPPIDQRLKELILKKQAAYGHEVLAMEIMTVRFISFWMLTVLKNLPK